MSRGQKVFLYKVVIIFCVLLGLLIFYFYDSEQNTIVIGTKNLTEQRLVAYMLEDVIEKDTDIKVDVVEGLDSTAILNDALKKGDVDMYVEYSSSAYIEIYKQIYDHTTDEEVISYIEEAYKADGLVWYENLGFDNSNVLICTTFCKDNSIETYSDLANNGEEFIFSAPAYFYSRSDGYNLLEDDYGAGFLEAVQKSMDSIITYTAILSEDVDVGLAFSTDAMLGREDYIVLEDNKGTFPKYDAGIVVREDTIDKFPSLEVELDKFNNLISTEDIRVLNSKVENDREDAQKVASDYILNKV